MFTQQFDNYYGVSHETIKAAKLNIKYGEKAELAKFLKELPNLIAEVNDEVYKQELVKLQSFYEDEKGFSNFKELVSNDVILIYRLRNMIVHNAICPEFVIKLYAHKAQLISGYLIQAVRYHYNKYGLDIDEALLRIYTDCQLLESNILMEIKRLKESSN
jgi:hypothetical protein